MALPDGGPGTASSRGSSEDASSPAEEEEEEEDEEKYMKRHALRQAEMNNELLVRRDREERVWGMAMQEDENFGDNVKRELSDSFFSGGTHGN